MSRLIFNAVLGGTTTLESTNSADTFLITVPAANGTMSIKDSSGDATFRNITLTGAVLAGAWNGSTITVPYGGTGAVTLTGYVKGNGTSAMTASATIPNTDITGLGTMSTQNANSVTITGGTISGLGTPLPVASGGSGAATLTGYVKGNGTSAYTASSTIPNTDITGLGTMSTQSADAVTITGGTANGLTIGASNPAAGIFTTLRVNSTVSLAGNTGTAGQVLTSNGASAPTWTSVAGVGTVTSVDGSGGTTGLTLTGGPITASGTLTLGGTLAVANGGTNITSYAVGDILYASASGVLSKLAAGTNGQVLTLASGLPSWANDTSGVTSFSAGTTGLTPSTSTTGAVTLAGTLGVANGGTGLTSVTANRIPYGNGTNALNTSANLTFDGTTLTSATGANFATTSGNVGIGTSSPTDKLEVVSSGSFVSRVRSTSGNSFLAFSDSGTTGIGPILGSNGNALLFGRGGVAEYMRIDSSGNVGIGTSSPAAKLSVVGTAYSPNITLSDAATIAWDTSTGQVATFTFVSSNRTMGAPTNLVNGAFYALAVIQNAGSNTLTWNSVFKWAAGTAPTLSTAAGAKDYFTFRSDGTNLYQQGISQAVA